MKSKNSIKGMKGTSKLPWLARTRPSGSQSSNCMQDTFARALSQARATIGYLVYNSAKRARHTRADLLSVVTSVYCSIGVKMSACVLLPLTYLDCLMIIKKSGL